MQIKKIGVIGAGQMGNGIAHVLSLGGYNVLLNDINKDILDKALSRMSLLISLRSTLYPPNDSTCAIPFPICPAPITPIFLICICASLFIVLMVLIVAACYKVSLYCKLIFAST